MSMLSDAKRDAPPVPDNTCPVIDKIQDGVEELITGHRATLEDVRKANEQLRESGIYWHDVAKEMQAHIETLENEVEELEKENQELRQALEQQEQAA